MKFVRETSPYIRKGVSVKRMMIDVLIALIPVTLFAIIQNKMGAISVILVSVVTMVLGELLCILIMKWPKGMKVKELFSKEGIGKVKANYTINNITAPMISAIIYAMICPANTSLYVVFIGALVAIILVKMCFGGLGSNIFNPAAVGRVVIGVCFGSQLDYSLGAVDVAAGGTPLAQIHSNLANLGEALKNYSLSDLFFGNVPGCMGEVSALMILIGAVYLFIRRSADIRAFLSMIVSFVILMVVAGLSAQIDVGTFVLYELLAGGILFGAVFMITDPVTSPTTKSGRILYGTLVGAVAALIRLVGSFPEGVAFAIILMNMFVPVIDYYRFTTTKYTYKQAIGYVALMAILSIVVWFSV